MSNNNTHVRLRVGDSSGLPAIIEGISPEVTLTEVAKGVRMDVTTKSGTKSALIRNGEPGADYVLTGDDKEDIAARFNYIKQEAEAAAAAADTSASAAATSAEAASESASAAASSATAAAGSATAAAGSASSASGSASSASLSSASAIAAAANAAASEAAAAASEANAASSESAAATSRSVATARAGAAAASASAAASSATAASGSATAAAGSATDAAGSATAAAQSATDAQAAATELEDTIQDVADLKSAINYVRKVTTETIIPDWHLGTISSANGKEYSSTNNIITARLKCYAGTSISIGAGDGYVMVAKYSLIDGSYIGVLGGWAKAYTLDEDCYCKFLAKNEASSTISDISEVVAKVNFDVYSENVLLPDVKESKENIAVISDYFVIGTNLFDKSTVIDGILAPTNGNITENSNYFISDYIPIQIDKTYTYQTDISYGSATMPRIAVYNSNKEYIGYFQGVVTDQVNVFTVSLSAVGVTISSDDIKYVRLSNIKAKLGIQQFCEGDTLPQYEPYGAKYLNDDFYLNETQGEQVRQFIASPLAGKKILYNGDSICESRLDESTPNFNGGAYAKMIADITGSTYINYAIGGATLASAVPSGANVQRRISRDLQDMDNDADLICLEGGINDYWFSVPLGIFVADDYTSTPDTTTIIGAMESICRQAVAKWIGKPICFVLTHKIYRTVYTQNTAGYTFEEAHEAILKVLKKYAIPTYDAFNDSGLNGYNEVQRVAFLNSNPSGTVDGCHPNESGYKKYYVTQVMKLFESILVAN